MDLSLKLACIQYCVYVRELYFQFPPLVFTKIADMKNKCCTSSDHSEKTENVHNYFDFWGKKNRGREIANPLLKI